ncbi:MAG: hypothetical protein CR988_06030 [Treponema sp.]|nr:MAG: hypothetical protein CR988_06030 [Treponema sp.]
MKKTIAFILSAFLFAGAFSVDAEILAVTGHPKAKMKSSWTTLNKGARLSTGAVISTGFKSTVTFKIGNSVLVLQPLSRLKLSEISNKGDSVLSKLYLETGSIKTAVQTQTAKKATLNIQTPVSVASGQDATGIITSFGKLTGLGGVWTYSGNKMNTAVRTGDSVLYSADGTTMKSPELLMLTTAVEKPLSFIDAVDSSKASGIETLLKETATTGNASIDFNIKW